ncbi:MAG TPA: hypothetical protein VG268_21435 [Streptosporangiaceae bacterium]|nr:hypothetical protein [Streptosporangiaceae bacterium]
MIWNNTVAGSGQRRPEWLSRLVWVSWRQHRATLIALGLLLAATAVSLLQAGLWIRGHQALAGWAENYQGLIQWVLPLGPISAGMFLGAPLLAREYADGTTSFAWTQDAGRLRPVLTKILLLGLIVLAAGVLIGWLTQWSVQPVATRPAANFDSWDPSLFDSTPVTEASLAVLAYAAGLLAGTVSRRVVPAMSATAAALIVFLAATYSRVHYWLFGLGLQQSRDRALGLAPSNSVQVDNGLVSLHRIAGPAVPGPAGSWLDQGRYLGPGGHRLSSGIVSR